MHYADSQNFTVTYFLQGNVFKLVFTIKIVKNDINIIYAII